MGTPPAWLSCACLALLGSFGCEKAPIARSAPDLALDKPSATDRERPDDDHYQIPRVDGIVVDGKFEDWRGLGLALDALSPLPPASFEPEQFDALARWAWSRDGLFAQVHVRDARLTETRAGEPIWQGDSLEFFIAPGVGASSITQVLLAPGLDAGQREPRFELLQHGGEPALVGPPRAARRAAADGYHIEVLFPWASAAGEKSDGSSLALQFYVNDAHDDGLRKLVWYPADGTHETARHMLAIRLSDDHASPRVTLAAALGVKGAIGAELLLVSRTGPAQPSLFSPSGSLQRRLEWKPNGPVWWSKLGLVLAPDDEELGPIRIVPERGPALRVHLTDVIERRAEALDTLKVGLESALFHGQAFPRISFGDSALLRELLGRYTLDVRWYDERHQRVDTPHGVGRYGVVIDLTSETGVRVRRQLSAFHLEQRAPRAQTTAAASYGARLRALGMPASTPYSPVLAGLFERFAEPALDDHPRLAALAAYLKNHPVSRSADITLARAAIADERWWNEQQKVELVQRPYEYLAHVPKPTNHERPLPALLFLHGSGERGDDLRRLDAWPPIETLKQRAEEHGFVLIAPQCPSREWWSVPKLEDLMETIKVEHPIDPERLYVMGASLGGYGTWELVSEHPDWFAAAVPICGGGSPALTNLLRELPLWVFHGSQDRAVPVERSSQMVGALRALNGRVRYTLYDHVGHAAWVPALRSTDLFEWLLRQRRGKPHQERSQLQGIAPDFVR